MKYLKCPFCGLIEKTHLNELFWCGNDNCDFGFDETDQLFDCIEVTNIIDWQKELIG